MAGRKFDDIIEERSIIMDSSPDVIHIFDGEGNSLDINKACETVEGIMRNDVLDKNIHQLLDEGVYNESATLKVLKQKKPVTIIQTTGAGKEVLVTATPFFKDGKIYRVICYSRDITELNNTRRRLEEADSKVHKYEEELKLYRSAETDTRDFIVESRELHEVVTLARRIAEMDTTVLIRGESGTGKEELCKIIHNAGIRRKGPFIKLNCAAIPEQLLESELFGYEAGAFTDALKQGKTGLIELADDGTLFLDEVGELPLSIQVKLLRVLQDKTIYRLGGNSPVKVDFRLISATNSNLEEKIKENQFREDFYYRLNVVPITIPPLRNRQDDIKALLFHFLGMYNRKYSQRKEIAPETMDLLMEYGWPGNIRELKNIIERMVVTVQDNLIKSTDLPPRLRLAADRQTVVGSGNLASQLNFLEEKIIRTAVKKNRELKAAASQLGIDRTTLFRKMKKYGIEN